MYLDPKDTSKRRMREAEHARQNRLEIVKALSQGEITKRDLMKWGILGAGGAIVAKNGLSPLARSAFAAVPTGIPPSPLFGAKKFTQPMSRLRERAHVPLTQVKTGLINPRTGQPEINLSWGGLLTPNGTPEPDSKRLSYDNDFVAAGGNVAGNPFVNPVTGRGPQEGRPRGEDFSHQRWEEFLPRAGIISSWTQTQVGTKFHPNFPDQNPDSAWNYGVGNTGINARGGNAVPQLIKVRYGESLIHRVYNYTPVDRAQNGGFGRNEQQLHFHNMHQGAESDGATNAHHFPGTFYDYRYSQTLARRDKTNTQATDPRASGPDGNGGLVNVPGDFREIVGTMWAHDHRFFFTAENVYKGNLMMVNVYSGKDRGNEKLNDGINLRLPSGSLLDFGNSDFDVNLVMSDGQTDPTGQYNFDIFTTDGNIGDLALVNFAWAPFFEVLPRKYRFRILNACMSRFFQFAFADSSGRAIPFKFIANDGNLVVNPLTLTQLDQQGIAERYDVIIDFSAFKVGDVAYMVDILQQTSGNKPDGAVSLANAIAGNPNDPVLGQMLQFRIVGSVQSVDVPGVTLRATDPDPSVVPAVLTEQIPIVDPVRTRVVEFGRGPGDSRVGAGAFAPCFPDCSEVVSGFPWVISVNGGPVHSMNANRISQLIPKAGEIEHWTYMNAGGGWDHPIHLHYEEGVTMNRGNDVIPPTERLVRKDVWRLRPAGQVTFQIQFGEFGGSYVNHCHNTVHEDFALLMRIQTLVGERPAVTQTPDPSPDFINFRTPEILAEGNPTAGNPSFVTKNQPGGGKFANFVPPA